MRSMVGKPRRGKAHAHRHAHAHARIKYRDGPRLRASPADGASQRAARCPSVPSAILFANPESFRLLSSFVYWGRIRLWSRVYCHDLPVSPPSPPSPPHVPPSPPSPPSTVATVATVASTAARVRVPGHLDESKQLQAMATRALQSSTAIRLSLANAALRSPQRWFTIQAEALMS